MTTTSPTTKLRPGDHWRVVSTPVGEMLLAGDAEALHHLLLPGSFEKGELDPAAEGATAPIEETARQLDEYFSHRRTSFELPLDPAGTEFQRRVWFALADIAYGETESYGSLAARVGNPKACRAVGMTNGRNPLPIVLPCHRVIGSNGSLTGYGGGLDLKRRLLDHERGLAATG
jgi:methylated-DNA-[protein]-cysteine S-methyltransferase